MAFARFRYWEDVLRIGAWKWLVLAPTAPDRSLAGIGVDKPIRAARAPLHL